MLDLRRFARLAAVHWAESGRSHLWFLGIGVVVHFCIWLLTTQGGNHLEHYDAGIQTAIYVFGYLVTAMLFAGRYFAALSRRESALTYLMRPASSFEKILLAFLVVAVLYPLAYTLAFQLCNLPGAWLGEAARDALVAAAKDPDSVLYLRNQDYGPYLPFSDPKAPGLEWNLFLGGIAIQGLVVAGTLYFHRLAWLKTLVALFLLLFVAIPLLSVATDAQPWHLFLDGPFTKARAGLRAWVWALWTGVPLLFWTANYFLLRERELQ